MAAYVSILVHELGHALVARRYGIEGEIHLNWFGGKVEMIDAFHSGRQKALVYLAGPLAQLALALLIVTVLLLVSTTVDWKFSEYEFKTITTKDGQLEFVSVWNPTPFAHLIYTGIILLLMNVGWPLFNLLPLPYLDGEIILRELLGGKGATPKKPPWQMDPNWWKRPKRDV